MWDALLLLLPPPPPPPPLLLLLGWHRLTTTLRTDKENTCSKRAG
jgi:hypothetical protein